MKSDNDFTNERFYRGERRRGQGRSQQRGAKTFRRGRAIAFLESMNLKRGTIQQQLEKPEFQSIQPILVGELKALDMVINEFSQLFDIQENEIDGATHNGEESPITNEDEKGMDLNETN